MNTGLSWNGDGTNWNQLLIGTLDESGKKLKVRWETINTLRATEAAWSSDGSQLYLSGMATEPTISGPSHPMVTCSPND